MEWWNTAILEYWNDGMMENGVGKAEFRLLCQQRAHTFNAIKGKHRDVHSNDGMMEEWNGGILDTGMMEKGGTDGGVTE